MPVRRPPDDQRARPLHRGVPRRRLRLDHFHVEIEEPIAPTLEAIRAAGRAAGLAVKPATPLSALEPYAELLDIVLIMTVEPGLRRAGVHEGRAGGQGAGGPRAAAPQARTAARSTSMAASTARPPSSPGRRGSTSSSSGRRCSSAAATWPARSGSSGRWPTRASSTGRTTANRPIPRDRMMHGRVAAEAPRPSADGGDRGDRHPGRSCCAATARSIPTASATTTCSCRPRSRPTSTARTAPRATTARGGRRLAGGACWPKQG